MIHDNANKYWYCYDGEWSVGIKIGWMLMYYYSYSFLFGAFGYGYRILINWIDAEIYVLVCFK